MVYKCVYREIEKKNLEKFQIVERNCQNEQNKKAWNDISGNSWAVWDLYIELAVLLLITKSKLKNKKMKPSGMDLGPNLHICSSHSTKTRFNP